MVEMESSDICDKNDILLVKSFTEDEDEKFTITFECDYDDDSNIIKIMKKCKFYELLFKLNGDLVSDFLYEKNEMGTGGHAVFYFKEKYEGHYICLSFDDNVICNANAKSVSIQGKSNDFDNFKDGYKKFDASEIQTNVEIVNGKIKVLFSVIITSDDLVNDIIAMMIKKQIFRLRKYVEKE